ncbi:MAG: IS66 family transposase, partial [Acidobacteria bacterium]|nr:IS66 family transposase [Acidobacteriota bacterium]
RRYFFNAYKGGDRKNGAEFIALIKQLYDVEEAIKEKSKDNEINLEEILAERQGKSRPVLDAIKKKIDTLLPIMK